MYIVLLESQSTIKIVFTNVAMLLFSVLLLQPHALHMFCFAKELSQRFESVHDNTDTDKGESEGTLASVFVIKKTPCYHALHPAMKPIFSHNACSRKGSNW